jgi:hypothetical protein
MWATGPLRKSEDNLREAVVIFLELRQALSY